MEDTLSPTPATTAEEAMASSRDTADKASVSGEAGGASAGAVAMATAGREEPGEEAEPWAATVPPVRWWFHVSGLMQTFIYVYRCSSLYNIPTLSSPFQF